MDDPKFLESNSLGRSRLLLFCLWGFLGLSVMPQLSWAWENLPEFGSLSEEEQQGFEGPGELHSEYFSDALTYGKSPDWEYRWLKSPRALDISFGSLSTRRFLMDHRVKIQVPLSELLEFRYNFFNEAHFERRESHHIFELAFWPFQKLGFSLYGEPSFRKPKDDTGLALMLRPTSRHEIRFFNTFVDVTRLKYPDTPDRFRESDLPYARGVVGRIWTPPRYHPELGDFFEYAFRYETPTRWDFPEDGYVYSYWRGLASLYGRKQFSDRFSSAVRFQFDRKREERLPTGAEGGAHQEWYTSRLNLQGQGTFYALGPSGNWEGTTGLALMLRTWDTEQGQASYRDLLPFVELKIPAWGTGERRGHWLLGYTLSWHRELGSTGIGIDSEDDGLIEQRLNLSYEFSFGPQGKLIILASADLDDFGTRKTWGGGSGKFQLSF